MRKLKFRALPKDSRNWVYGCNSVTSPNDDNLDLSTFFGKVNNGELRQETVSQFTCIRDIDDNDIYEHDILDIEGFLTKVTFDGGALSVDVRGKSYDYTAVGWTEEAMKIVGNTYTDQP